MNRNCKHRDDYNEGIRRHVHGNVLRLAIPLTLISIEYNGENARKTKADFFPSNSYPVVVELRSPSRKYPFTATMRNGNVACIEDKGTLPIDVYSITVLCKDDNGDPYRFKQNSALHVVDTTAEAGIEVGVEFDGEEMYLDAAVFFAVSNNSGVREQADWSETDEQKASFIRNKPDIPQETVVDDEMSDSSTNPVQNKVVKAYVDRASQRIGYSVSFEAGNVIFSGSNQPMFNDGNIIL